MSRGEEKVSIFDFSVLIGIESGFVDVICSVRNANFLVLNGYRIYYEHQSLVPDEPSLRRYDLTHEDFNFGMISMRISAQLFARVAFHRRL